MLFDSLIHVSLRRVGIKVVRLFTRQTSPRSVVDSQRPVCGGLVENGRDPWPNRAALGLLPDSLLNNFDLTPTFFIVGCASRTTPRKTWAKKAASLRSAGNRSLRSRILLANRFLDNLDFLISQPV